MQSSYPNIACIFVYSNVFALEPNSQLCSAGWCMKQKEHCLIFISSWAWSTLRWGGRWYILLPLRNYYSCKNHSTAILVALPNSINPSNTGWQTGEACDLIKMNWLRRSFLNFVLFGGGGCVLFIFIFHFWQGGYPLAPFLLISFTFVLFWNSHLYWG